MEDRKPLHFVLTPRKESHTDPKLLSLYTWRLKCCPPVPTGLAQSQGGQACSRARQSWVDNAEKCFPLASHPIMSREDYKPPAGTALWWGNGEEMVHQVGSVPPTPPQHPTELLTCRDHWPGPLGLPNLGLPLPPGWGQQGTEAASPSHGQELLFACPGTAAISPRRDKHSMGSRS